MKDPILIKNSYNYEEISEKILKRLILEDLVNFMKELGEYKKWYTLEEIKELEEIMLQIINQNKGYEKNK